MVADPATVNALSEPGVAERIASASGVSIAIAGNAFLAAVVLLSGAFCLGIVRGVRRLVFSLAAKAMPQAEPGKPDLAAAPRRASSAAESDLEDQLFGVLPVASTTQTTAKLTK